MTREEAIKYISQHAYIDDEVKDMCIEALKKQISKKPKSIEQEDYGDCYVECSCGAMSRINEIHTQVFCWKCGQAIDWEQAYKGE